MSKAVKEKKPQIFLGTHEKQQDSFPTDFCRGHGRIPRQLSHLLLQRAEERTQTDPAQAHLRQRKFELRKGNQQDKLQ